MSTSLFSLLSSAVRENDAENEHYSNLWDWLPSHAAHKKHFGDYALDVGFNRVDVAREASMVFGTLNRKSTTEDHALEWFYVSEEVLAENEKIVPPREERLDFIAEFFRTEFNCPITFTT